MVRDTVCLYSIGARDVAVNVDIADVDGSAPRGAGALLSLRTSPPSSRL